MQQTRILMGMPVSIEIADVRASEQDFDAAYEYLAAIDERFSTYKETSEISKINRGELQPVEFSLEMREVFRLSAQTKHETNGYFDIQCADGTYDPSGLVKGWAIHNAAMLLKARSRENFYVEAGGDMQVYGKNGEGNLWQVGIRNPFQQNEIIKVVELDNYGIATSGNYIRGDHIYNPKDLANTITDIVSLTIIGPDVYEADRFATAAFAMGDDGIHFIENLPGFEGYSIDRQGIATYTTGFERFVVAA